MRVEGLSANKITHFSVILEVGFQLPTGQDFSFPNSYVYSVLIFCFNMFGVKVFEVAPTFFMVDIQKAAGDAAEYLKVRYLYPLSLLSFYIEPEIYVSDIPI